MSEEMTAADVFFPEALPDPNRGVKHFLSDLAKSHTVTIDDGIHRESGLAVVPVQMKWYELRFVHDPSFDRMIPYGKAEDGEWYVDFGKGYERIEGPIKVVPRA